ncbi:hypothetical protein MWU57_04355 [Isoptericola sp. S6320L]|uniref:hypothetical protein n=1 Tax=Isoptericola sp. S6320L TaxID=2926411 RepID=UPI001FF5658A|nr:hypothetical protein [Isoptericola sp. S6320L]MCK0116257.1 hypothetical protein [Isoptericola sp. S6320L]
MITQHVVQHRRGRRTTATLAVLAALVLSVVAWVAAVPQAAAHGGELKIDVGTDGAGGVDAVVVWAADGHPVEETVDVTIKAVSDTGEEVGPVQLTSASEGVGWYRSEPGLLGEGHWTLTVRATEPSKHKSKTELDVVAPPTPTAEPSAEPAGDESGEPAGGDEAGAEPAADSADATDTASTAPAGPAPWVWIVLGLAAVGVAALILVRRRRSA